jgi:hypothetical protein
VPLQLLGLLGTALSGLAAESSTAAGQALAPHERQMLRQLAGGLLPAVLAAASGLRRGEVLYVLERCAAPTSCRCWSRPCLAPLLIACLPESSCSAKLHAAPELAAVA